MALRHAGTFKVTSWHDTNDSRKKSDNDRYGDLTRTPHLFRRRDKVADRLLGGLVVGTHLCVLGFIADLGESFTAWRAPGVRGRTEAALLRP
ncbi:hypothetical protein J7I94_21450 [Streptomyces sp. ISL-12]|uniref:hypothetical protein n=1 Tax=Streptomyces sp. ISL-12 TaxID=2819177 RepID=UPI001BEAC0EC|nr:hypothetical protein [Streptomyces sp. ISL-12]MBT2413094.1 hypothetical protein [Streptomyces sp. ISL-12]